jgi:MFS family permease
LGVGAALGTAVATLTEFEPTGDHRRAARVGATAAVVGLATGPLASGVFAEYVPWPTVFVYMAHLGLLVPSFLGIWAMPETIKEAARGVASPLLKYLSVPQGIRRPFALAAMVAFGAFSVVAVYMSLGPSVAEALLRIDSRMAAGVVVFALMGTSAVGQLGFRG